MRSSLCFESNKCEFVINIAISVQWWHFILQHVECACGARFKCLEALCNCDILLFVITRLLFFDVIMVKKQLTDVDLAEIMVARSKGTPVKELARKYNVDRTTIWRRLKTFFVDRRLSRKKTARRLKLTTTDQERLREFLRCHPFSNYQAILYKLDLNISVRTLSAYLRLLGLRQYISPKKFFVRDVDCEDRMNVALTRSFWSIDQWKKVVFCDESGIDKSGTQWRFVIRPQNCRFHQQFVYRAPNKTLKVHFFTLTIE